MARTKYICISKVSNDKFIRHHSDSLRNYKKFLLAYYHDWRFTNVYSKSSRDQVGFFTKSGYSGGNINLSV